MDSQRVLGTAQVPSELWKAAQLIGFTPFLASSYDQRASYCLYVPEAHYQVTGSPKLPLIVAVHGSERRAERCRDWLVDVADSVGAAILAPLFPAGIDDPNDMHNYKFVKYKNIRYDLILLSMVDEVARRWPGIETDKFYLAGFSGGGQFVSRFMLLHPHRLEGVSIGAPGTVTSLDDSLEWPRGLKNVNDHFDGISVDVNALKSVKYVHLAVGADDVHPPDGGLLRWFAKQNKTTEIRLPARTDALAKLRDELVAVGVNVQYEIVPDAAHEAVKVFPTMVRFLHDSLKKL